MPTTFEDFECVFLEHYSPLDNANVARDKLCELKQCGAVQDYIMAFDNIVALLPELLEAEQIHAFVYGLKPYIHNFIKA